MTVDDVSESDEARFPRRFHDYVLVTPLGSGGMGRVYAALSSKAELCAIKRFGNPRAPLPTHLLEQNKTRFLREAEITKALQHPGIPRTYESVHTGSDSYLVQEFVAGMTLDYFMGALSGASPEQHLPIALATHIAIQIADALAYLHEFRGLGLIHRDLTATNVMLSQKGEVKVIDFGIAKATIADDGLTQPNLVVGKPLWTAPEVRQGKKPDRRTDLYALGLLYWYLLSGEDPTDHLDENPNAQLPPPSTFRAEIPGALDGLVVQAVHAHPDRRFQTAQEFHLAIARFLPKGYPGVSELATIVRRYQLTSEDEFFAELVNRARPLLAQTRPPPAKKSISRAPTKFRRSAIFLGSAALLLSLGAFFIFRGAPATKRQESIARKKESNDSGSRVTSPGAVWPSSGPDLGAFPSAPPKLIPVQSASESQDIIAQPQPPPAAPGRPKRNPNLPDRLQSRPNRRDALPSESPQSPAVAAVPSPPQDFQALLAAAKDAVVDGDNAKALRLAHASIDAHPSVAAYLLIARISWSDKPAARDALEAALALSPGNSQAGQLLQSLNRSDPNLPK